MSTTNLFDERQKPKGYTVASTNQAASAESLQHQTPSLENLLARSRIYGDRIPEVVGSDGEQTPSNATPEPRPFGSETVCPSSEQLDGSSQSMHTPTSNTIQTSVAASTFGGGSQPVLSMSSKHQGSHQLLGTSQSAVSLEKDHHHHQSGANPPKRSSNSKNLSASEPDLVGPTVPSARQQRQRSFVPASSLMEDPMLFMEEDEEEESEKAEQPIIDEPEELSGVLVERVETNVVLPKGRNTALSRTSTNSSASRFLSDIVDVECMDEFINSQEFYGGLVDAYSEINYMGSALLQDLVSEGNAGSHPTPSAAQTALQQLNSSTNNDDSITSSSSSNAQSRRQLANLGMGLRLKLGNYADVLRA
uniref:Uncharacterized protein n=1 Tax=Ditylenchus dipsaci TaxID=166011 RepID=A0A915DDN7_9BILA